MLVLNLPFKALMFLTLMRPSLVVFLVLFFFSSRRRHTRLVSDWSSDVCSSDLYFLSCGLPLNCLNEEVGGMARQGWSMSEMEIRRIAFLLSETDLVVAAIAERMDRSEERRVGKECRCRWWAYHEKKEEK